MHRPVADVLADVLADVPHGATTCRDCWALRASQARCVLREPPRRVREFRANPERSVPSSAGSCEPQKRDRACVVAQAPRPTQAWSRECSPQSLLERARSSAKEHDRPSACLRGCGFRSPYGREARWLGGGGSPLRSAVASTPWRRWRAEPREPSPGRESKPEPSPEPDRSRDLASMRTGWVPRACPLRKPGCPTQWRNWIRTTVWFPARESPDWRLVPSQPSHPLWACPSRWVGWEDFSKGKDPCLHPTNEPKQRSSQPTAHFIGFQRAVLKRSRVIVHD